MHITALSNNVVKVAQNIRNMLYSMSVKKLSYLLLHIFLCTSQGDGLHMNVLSSLVYLPAFPRPFSQQLDNLALSASFYIYIAVLVLMYY